MKGWICLILLMLVGIISDVFFNAAILGTSEYAILCVGSFICLEIDTLKNRCEQTKEKSDEDIQ